MTRELRIGAALVAAATLIGAVTLWQISGHLPNGRTYRIGYGGDAPLHFRGADGQPTGVAAEIVKTAAKRRGIRLDWLQVPHPGVDSIRFHEVDLWVLLTDLPERHKLVHFTQPYLSAERSFVVLTASHITSLDGLRQARIGYRNSPQNAAAAAQGSAPNPPSDLLYMRRILPGAKPVYVPYDLVGGPWKELIEQHVDALLLNKAVATALLLAGGNRGDLAMLPAPASGAELALASSFETAPVADQIRDEIRAMAED